MEYAYYVRYGLMGRVGRFPAVTGGIERGRTVVLETHRGTELGAVLAVAPRDDPGHDRALSANRSRVLRAATDEDLARAERVARDRPRRFEVCQRVFEEGVWPFDVIDVEPLLDEGRTVVHYLGPHDLDVSGLLALFRSAHALDVVFEAAGRDADEPAADMPEESGSGTCGHCGDRGGGCHTGGCGASAHAGGSACSDCALMKWTTRRVPAGR
jgi:hypothetical protein